MKLLVDTCYFCCSRSVHSLSGSYNLKFSLKTTHFFILSLYAFSESCYLDLKQSTGSPKNMIYYRMSRSPDQIGAMRCLLGFSGKRILLFLACFKSERVWSSWAIFLSWGESLFGTGTSPQREKSWFPLSLALILIWIFPHPWSSSWYEFKHYSLA